MVKKGTGAAAKPKADAKRTVATNSAGKTTQTGKTGKTTKKQAPTPDPSEDEEAEEPTQEESDDEMEGEEEDEEGEDDDEEEKDEVERVNNLKRKGFALTNQGFVDEMRVRIEEFPLNPRMTKGRISLVKAGVSAVCEAYGIYNGKPGRPAYNGVSENPKATASKAKGGKK